MEDILKDLKEIVDGEAGAILKEQLLSGAQLLRDVVARIDEDRPELKSEKGITFFIGRAVTEESMKNDPHCGAIIAEAGTESPALRIPCALEYMHTFSSQQSFKEFLSNGPTLCTLHEVRKPIAFLARIQYSKSHSMTILTMMDSVSVFIKSRFRDECKVFTFDLVGAKGVTAMVKDQDARNLLALLSRSLHAPAEMRKNNPKLWKRLMQQAAQGILGQMGLDPTNFSLEMGDDDDD